MPKYKVRPGYVLKIGHARYHEGNVMELSQKEIEDQLWKVEELPEEVAREKLQHSEKIVIVEEQVPAIKKSVVQRNRAVKENSIKTR